MNEHSNGDLEKNPAGSTVSWLPGMWSERVRSDNLWSYRKEQILPLIH